MPKFPYLSAKEVLARVLRNTGYKLPPEYHDDMLEWLPEGLRHLNMTKLYTTLSTPKVSEPDAYYVKNHVVSIPCGALGILAIEDEFGTRIPEGSDITDLSSPSSRYHGNDTQARPTTFNVDPLEHQTTDGVPTDKPGSSVPLYGEDLSVENNTNAASYYKIMGNKIQFSFEEGLVRVHYQGLVVDEEGYPMIPDNENFKTALYWYILMMLIGAGYEHKIFSYQFAEAQFEKYGGRALAEIKFPSLDEKARIHRSLTRLVPPHHFYEDFFINAEQTQYIAK